MAGNCGIGGYQSQRNSNRHPPARAEPQSAQLDNLHLEIMVQLLSLKFQLLVILDAQTTFLAHLVLLHMQPVRRQGPGFYYWQCHRDASLTSLESLLNDLF